MKKRTLALLLAGAMAFSLTACKKSNGENNTTANDQTDIAQETTAAAEPIKQTGTVADYSQYISLGQYAGIDIPVDAAVVTDDDIQNYKDSLVYYYNNYLVQAEQLKEGVTAEGDVINYDYSGLLDGVAFDGGTAAGQTYTVGSGLVIEDLDRQLAGLEVGKEYELPCTFPEDYKNNPDLAGKEVIFVVTVNYIEGEKPQYEWGDEFVGLYTSGEYTSAEAYEEWFTADLLANAQEEQNTEYINSLWTQVVANCTVSSLPEEKTSGIADDYYGYYTDYFTYYASLYGMDMTSFLSSMYGMTEDDLKTECRSMAEQEVSYIMAACEIYKALGNTLSDEEYNARAAEAAAQYGYESAAAFVEDYGEEYVRESFIFDIVSDYLEANNHMVINE